MSFPYSITTQDTVYTAIWRFTSSIFVIAVPCQNIETKPSFDEDWHTKDKQIIVKTIFLSSPDEIHVDYLLKSRPSGDSEILIWFIFQSRVSLLHVSSFVFKTDISYSVRSLYVMLKMSTSHLLTHYFLIWYFVSIVVIIISKLHESPLDSAFLELPRSVQMKIWFPYSSSRRDRDTQHKYPDYLCFCQMYRLKYIANIHTQGPIVLQWFC